jgi:regulator of protease activity HflC (stomatin/prohibitin superfamily)
MDLNTAGRRDIQDELKANLSKKRGIIIEDVLLKDLKLPDMLARSIELKLETEQEAKQMVLVLEKEQQ